MPAIQGIYYHHPKTKEKGIWVYLIEPYGIKGVLEQNLNYLTLSSDLESQCGGIISIEVKNQLLDISEAK